MNQAAKQKSPIETKLIESIGYVLDPNWKPSFEFWILDSSGTSIGDPYKSRRDMVSDQMLGSDISEAIKAEYLQNLEGRYSDDDLIDFAFEHFEDIAAELGYRVLKVVK